MKNFIRVLSLCCYLPIVSAGSMGNDGSNYSIYDGFYIGADIGGAGLINHINVTHPYTLTPPGNIGLVGGGLVGYDYTVYDRFKLGLEAFLNANGMQAEVSNYPDYRYRPYFGTYHMHAKYNMGFRALPAFELTPGTQGHVIFGYSSARMTMKDNGTLGYLNVGSNFNGFQTGVGLSTLVAPNLSVRLDALYTGYNEQTFKGHDLSYTIVNYYRMSYTAMEGDLTVSYKFAGF